MIVSTRGEPATPYHVGFLEVLFCLSFAWWFACVLLAFCLRFAYSESFFDASRLSDWTQKSEPTARAQFPSPRFPQIPRQIAWIALYWLQICHDDKDHPPAVDSAGNPESLKANATRIHFSPLSQFRADNKTRDANYQKSRTDFLRLISNQPLIVMQEHYARPVPPSPQSSSSRATSDRNRAYTSACLRALRSERRNPGADPLFQFGLSLCRLDWI
jgi:hypothetical protein